MSAHRHRHHHHHRHDPDGLLEPSFGGSARGATPGGPDGLLEPDWGDAAPAVDPDMLAMARASGLAPDAMANLEAGKHEAVTELMIPYAD